MAKVSVKFKDSRSVVKFGKKLATDISTASRLSVFNSAKMAEFLNREGRTTCWERRDSYWACLDKYAPDFNRNNDQEKEPKECVELRKLFISGCPSQWIRHFDRKRTYEQFKKRMEQGFDPLKKEEQKQ